METTDREKHIPRKLKQVTQAFYLLLGLSAMSLLLFIANAIIVANLYMPSAGVLCI